jgi:hypothetical protein
LTTATTPATLLEAEPRASYKVRHALLAWVEGGRTLNAFRGQIVELPASEARRLMPYGAIIPPEMDLDRPGVLMELPLAPSDEELINWVMSASPAEVSALASQRPELAPRLEGAWRHIVNERQRQDEHLERVRLAMNALPPTGEQGAPAGPTGELIDDDIVFGAPEGATTGRADGVVTLPPPQDQAGSPQSPGAAPVAPNPATVPGPGQPATEIDALVRGDVSAISSYLAEHPEDAQVVLDAETRFQAAQGNEARAAVRTAVGIASSFGTE